MSHVDPDSFRLSPSCISIWTQFCTAARVLKTCNRDYLDWRRGRIRYYIWVLPIENVALLRRHAATTRLLRRYLVNPDTRLPHVTIHVAGFACEQPIHDDDISRSDIARQSEMLRSRWNTGLSLYAGGLNSFLSAPFIELRCRNGELNAIRQDLANIVPEQRFTRYIPHVTVGVYNAPYATRDLARLMTPWRRLPLLVWAPASIDLVSIDARQPVGSLQLEERVAIPLSSAAA